MLLVGRFKIPVVMLIPDIIFDEIEMVLPSAVGKSVSAEPKPSKTEVIVELPSKNSFGATKGYNRNKSYLGLNQGRIRGKRKW